MGGKKECHEYATLTYLLSAREKRKKYYEKKVKTARKYVATKVNMPRFTMSKKGHSLVHQLP